MQPYSRWFKLSRKRVNDRVDGELRLTVSVMPKYAFEVVREKGRMRIERVREVGKRVRAG
jgi:hypothetical protein